MHTISVISDSNDLHLLHAKIMELDSIDLAVQDTSKVYNY